MPQSRRLLAQIDFPPEAQKGFQPPNWRVRSSGSELLQQFTSDFFRIRMPRAGHWTLGHLARMLIVLVFPGQVVKASALIAMVPVIFVAPLFFWGRLLPFAPGWEGSEGSEAVICDM